MSDRRENGDDGGQQGTKGPSAKDKADLYIALGKSAQERFNVHHGVEWKIHFGLWTLFVAGAVFLIHTSIGKSVRGVAGGGKRVRGES